MKKIPEWARKTRKKWKYRGQKRPPFAVKPNEGQESVWDYPRPPKLDPDKRLVTVKSDDITIAETRRAIRILETASPPVFYIPPEDVNTQYLVQSDQQTQCEWKSTAVYWHLKFKDNKIDNACWSYPVPFDEFEAIKGYFSFYPAKVNCFVGHERAAPQPGNFYGGWMTSEIVGPVKGDSKIDESY